MSQVSGYLWTASNIYVIYLSYYDCNICFLDSSKEGISRKAVEAVPSLILAPALKVSSDDNPCKNLKDGRYAVRDVAKYLLCHFRHGHVLPCRSGRIFSPKNGRCVPVNRVDPGGLFYYCYCSDFSLQIFIEYIALKKSGFLFNFLKKSRNC